MFDILSSNKSYKIMIDHHEEPDDFCDQTISNPSVSSTAELIYDFITNLNYHLNNIGFFGHCFQL